MKEDRSLILQVWRGLGFANLGFRVIVTLQEVWQENKKKKSSIIYRNTTLYTGSSEDSKIVKKQIIEYLCNSLGDIIIPSLEGFKTYSFIEGLNVKDCEKIISALNNFKLEITPKPILPVIFKLEEKHYTFNYVLTSIDQAKEVFLFTLNRSIEEGRYDWMKDFIPYNIQQGKVPKFSKKEIQELPESMSSVKQDLLEQIKSYEHDLSEQKKYRDLYQQIRQVLKEKDGFGALEVLEELRNEESIHFKLIVSDVID